QVYAMLQKADTVGVFQIESRAQMATLPRMKPRTFYDLVVEVAIIRPGPIVGRMVHPFLDRRSGRTTVCYDHPSLEPILRRTLGVPLFQEQLLRIAMAVAGFSAGEAEELRRAMGFKRSVERMSRIEQRLRAGMAHNGIHGEVADRIVRSITSFALYGFPESHAASFALIAYASAYLKCHHPAAFLGAMLNCFPLGFYHPATLVKDAQRHGVKVMPIDVTHSDWKCTLEKAGNLAPAVRLGLKYVNGLREDVGLHVEGERRRQCFRSIADFSARVAPNKRELAALAYSGAFATFGMTRREALWQAAAIEHNPKSLLAGIEPSAPSALENERGGGSTQLPAMTDIEQTLADYSATTVTTGPHVVAHLRQMLRSRGILSAAELADASNGSWAKVAGVVIVRQRPGTAKGLLFLTLEDETGIANAMVTPELFHANRGLLHRAQMLIVEGPLQKHEGVIHVLGRRFTELKLNGAMPKSHDFH
ncbi:MAG: error-prone DNA polymerase, partial [Deltaproteobacteria bacterium]|nr:error-prone DNA polymerase [Deltaproteobacteria bacterium]